LASGSPKRNLIGFHHQHGNGNDNGPMLGYKFINEAYGNVFRDYCELGK